MTSNMIESVKESKFRLPSLLMPIVAFGLYLIGDMSGGMLGMWACNQFDLTGAAAERILLLSVGFTALLIMLWVKLIEGRRIESLGLGITRFTVESVIGAIAGLLSFTGIVVIGYILGTVVYQDSYLSPTCFVSVLLMIPFWIIQAGTEELLTRGWILPEVSEGTNKLIGILISSILFVLLHMDNNGLSILPVINIFLIGVLLSVYTLQSNSLWGAIMYHAFWNCTQSSFLGMSVSGGASVRLSLISMTTRGSDIISGGAFGIEGSIITTAVLLMSLTVLFLYTKSNSL